MADPGDTGSEQDDVSFLRTDDMICLQCTSTGERVCLAAAGFGNRQCYLENIADKNFPADISTCVFVLEQALSVRALQEMVTAVASDNDKETQSGHRTLLYGHAVLLRHQNSDMYLACLSTSSSSDKLAFDVGLQQEAIGEACWWTIHPASKQRSEGEKVRVGDDLILVSVATERYLHTAKEGEQSIVNASFHLTHWSVAPFGTGSSRVKSVGYVFGGEVLRFFHGGDECLTIPPTWSELPSQNIVVYEGGAVVNQARSLWRLELVRTKWAGGYINWGHLLRIRHITTGRYLGFAENYEVTLVKNDEATVAATAFCLAQTKDEKKVILDEKDEEVIGAPLVKYGDTTVFLQHIETGLWLSYKTYETKKRGVGKVEEKQAIMSEEGKMDDGLEFSRSQEEESRTARVIRKCDELFNKFIKGLDLLQSNRRQSSLIKKIDHVEIIRCLEDLIEYFAQPEAEIEHEEKQTKLRALRNRQDLFQEEGILNLILEAIDKINIITSQGYMVALAGEAAGESWDAISGYLYKLLAAIIMGNHTNCAQFAQSHRLDWLFSRLGSQQAAEGTGMLDVLHCVLIDSPEALNMMKEEHIKVIISLLEKHGRDKKVLHVLSSLCVGNGVAVRSSQNNICDNLLSSSNLLARTKLVDHVSSVHPNLFVGKVDASAMYKKWYYEATLDHIEQVTHMEPHLRIGWANTMGYVPYPGGGEKWGGNGIGDDLYSFGFDGSDLRTGGQSYKVRQTSSPRIKKGDVIGCALDLTIPMISFTINGSKIKGIFKNFNTDGMFYPCISVSARLSCRFLLGGDHGRLKYGPPENHTPIIEALISRTKLSIEPCFHFGIQSKGVLMGPSAQESASAFVPVPVDTSMISLPSYVETIREKLAENIHETWAMGKIESGWIYGEKRDDAGKKHPCLTAFEKLPNAEKRYVNVLSFQTLKTILALRYHITMDKPPSRIKTVKLSNDPYLQPNGYKPAPLDLCGIKMAQNMEALVNNLAENTHNVWAKERIRQGWTFSVDENSKNKRSPHLVQYQFVDETIKKVNTNTATEAVKTLLAYGYVLETPTGDTSDEESKGVAQGRSRTYRAEKTYAVTEGKWYFEFEVLTSGFMRVGWATVSCVPNEELGSDEFSWVFDGYRARKYSMGVHETFGKQWQVGDIVGCLLDLNDKNISFSLNGELLMDSLGGETAFSDIQVNEGFVPAFTLGTGQSAKLIFGQDVNTLKFFTMCGLQEGYEPFCVNMDRNMTFWYTKDQPIFSNIDNQIDSNIEVTRIPAGSDTPPCLKVTHKQFEEMEKLSYEFLRLSLPVTCNEVLIPETSKDKRLHELITKFYREKGGKLGSRIPAQLIAQEDMLKSGFSMADIKDLHRGYSEDADETLQALNLEDTSQGFACQASAEKKLTKTQSYDMGISQLALPNGTPEPGKLRPSTSEETLHKSSESNLQRDSKQSHTNQAKVDRTAKRGKSPFKFFSKKDKKDKAVPVKASQAKLSRTDQNYYTQRKSPVSPTASNMKSATIKIVTPSSSDQKIIPPSVPERSNTLSAPTIEKGMLTTPRTQHRKSLTGAEAQELDGDILEYCSLDEINEYYFGLRIFPGQDPSHIYVGWVTSNYHYYDKCFDISKVRRATFTGVDAEDFETQEKQNCYMVQAGQLHSEVSMHDASSRNANQGMYIGCHIDLSTGIVSFTANGKDTKQRFKLEAGTMLFPAVFFEATSKEVLQLELGRARNTLPLSAALLHSIDKHLVPQCPPRLKVQTLKPNQWARVPNQSLKMHSLKLSDIRGWSMLCEDPVSMLAVHIPEEDRCIDVLELIEEEKLLSFHAHTLALYGAICFQGNHRAAHIVCQHVDEKQLMYAIKSEYMSGPLRIGFADLLIALHLEFHAYGRSLTQREFIIPLGDPLRNIYAESSHAHSFSLLECGSIRPEMTTTATTDQLDNFKDLHTPEFPVDVLKQFVMEALDDAVKKGIRLTRDPIGGTNENLFVPLIKLVDKLFLIGLMDNTSLKWLLILIDPETFDEESNKDDPHRMGLMQMKLDEGVKLQMCYLLHHLCDNQLRHRIESIINFCDFFVKDLQADQLRRYIEIKQSDLPSAVAAKKTKEFRCPPREQMKAILSFKNLEEDQSDQCPCNEAIQDALGKFHEKLMFKAKININKGPQFDEKDDSEVKTSKEWSKKLMSLVSIVKKSEDLQPEEDELVQSNEDIFSRKIANTIIKWAEEKDLETPVLIREMFHLLLRQYESVNQLISAIDKTYIISEKSQQDIIQLLVYLGRIRSLLPVQMGPDEEEVMRENLWALVNNKVFFQHPDLICILSVHEDVMNIMTNALEKRAQKHSSPTAQGPEFSEKDTSHEMIVACCRFLCYFCRSSRKNQKAMFDHLDFLLENSNILLSRPSLRGSAPLDVAYSSLMENNELALALREHYLEKIAIYLSRCGLQSNQELLDNGYPDVGWDPVEGERYLDFLRFCVWVNGESVEENANLVIRLLIRRPECLGPALRGEGQGLLQAIQEAIKMSEIIAEQNSMSKEELELKKLITHPIAEDDDEDYIDMGGAILNFYCALVDLLGRCAPEAASIKLGKNDALRARAILKSLVPFEDLQGVLSLKFTIQNLEYDENGDPKCDLPPGLLPIHKQSVMLFLERVYGIVDQETFFKLLEDAFLPDLRAATMIERPDGVESDMALAQNRYIGNSILPLLIKYCNFFSDADNYANLLDATLHTVYRLCKCKILTKGQREAVSDFLVALTREMHPGMLLPLLRKLTVDVSQLNEYTTVALRLLTLHFERCGRYYGSSGGQGSYGSASEEEKRLTMMLCTNIFDSLAKMEYDPDLFNKALPCLTAISCALPPDYSLTKNIEEDLYKPPITSDGPYIPQPVNTSSVQLSSEISILGQKFSEHYHDAWAALRIENGWNYGTNLNVERKLDPLIRPYNSLSEWEKEKYWEPTREALKALMALGWQLELSDSSHVPLNRTPSRGSLQGDNYNPDPVDMSTLTLSRELQTLASRLSQNGHEIWAKKTKDDLLALGGDIHPKLVPYDLLTDKEKREGKALTQELMKYLEYQGYKVFRMRMNDESSRDDSKTSSDKNRFASAFLEKMLTYLDSAALNMKVLKPSNNYSHRSSFRTSSKDAKFFSKVVLPLIEKYFPANKDFFLAATSTNGETGAATVNERKMVTNLFCKLASLLRAKMSVFGSDARMTVRCLQVLIKASDPRTLVKNCPDFVKTSVLTFFNYAAEDLENTVMNLQQGRYSQIRGTTMKTSSSLNYIQLVLLPVLTTLFDHLCTYDFGEVLLTDDIQVACYKILHSVFKLGTDQKLFSSRTFLVAELERHRALYGRFLGAFSSTFPVAFLEPSLNKYNQFSIHGKLEEHSLEAQDVMSKLEASLPTLEDLMTSVEKFVTDCGDYKDAPYVIDVILPMLCSYLPFWWSQGPDSVNLTSGNHITMVTSDHLNLLLNLVLNLIKNNVGREHAPWMISIAAYAGQIIINSSETLLSEIVLPLAEKMCNRTEHVFHHEEQLKSYLKSTTEDTSQVESELQEEYILLVRDLYAFYPLLIKYIDIQRAHWLKQNNPDAAQLYKNASRIFNLWSLSQFFRREEQNFITAHEIDNMALIMPSGGRRSSTQPIGADQKRSAKRVKKRGEKKRDKDKEVASSLMVACLKRLLAVGLNLFAGREQEIVQNAKEQFLKRVYESDIYDNVKIQLTVPDKVDPSDAMNWQHHLYSKLGSKKSSTLNVPLDSLVQRIIDMAKVLYGLHVIDHPEHIFRCKDRRPGCSFVHALLNLLIDHPQGSQQSQWRSKVSTQRKRAVIACFRMTSLHSLPRHSAINIFLGTYKDVWLSDENVGQEILIEDLTQSFEDSEKKKGQEILEMKPDPLSQLVTNFCRSATTEHSGVISEDLLYMLYAEIIANSCSGSDEEEADEGDDEDAGPSIHEQEMEKQKLLFEQARLADRGVAEMILLQISACKGVSGPMVMNTLKLGISLLRGGNIDVQKRMIKHLKEKKDVGFFTSISMLMNQCGVLDLDAFERNQKAEGLGVGSEGAAGEKNMHDADQTCTIFRFLQLLCEGHNLEFQNYLRTQAGNTTTVNIVICTVDYLLRLQESVMDFYWHYSSKSVIDPPGKENFGKAITVAKQVFNTLTEYLQGPCPLNQQALAHSRLWDAVTGFLFLFAHMQYKLAKHSSQLDVLTELLELQKEMVIMMLSMLEGNVMNGTIGKQMLDTLVESASNVEMILKFFDMFLKLKDLTTSSTFQEIDPSQTGFITPKEFKRAMEQQKTYTTEEITFLMVCCESSEDEKIDYIEFTERFHNTAKEIGFALAVLLTNLSEHITNDPRLSRFLETASSVLEYFEPFLGRIEILGGSKRIERVYFEIKEANLEQWEKPQIKESKRAFFYSIVTEGGDKEKLEAFINFCEDAIFEMQHASNMTMEEEKEVERHSATSGFPGSEEEPPPSAFEPMKKSLVHIKRALSIFLSYLTPSNLKSQYSKLCEMSYPELLIGFVKLCGYSTIYGFWGIYFVTKTLICFIMLMMGGQNVEKSSSVSKESEKMALVPLNGPVSSNKNAMQEEEYSILDGIGGDLSSPMQAFGVNITKTEEDGEIIYTMSTQEPDDLHSSSDTSEDALCNDESSTEKENSFEPADAETASKTDDLKAKSESSETVSPQTSIYETEKPKEALRISSPSSAKLSKKSGKASQESTSSVDFGEYSYKFLSFLARNFYTMKYMALTLAFLINFMLLFFKVSTIQGDVGSAEATSGEADASKASAAASGSGEGGDDDSLEFITLAEKVYYLEPLLRVLALMHMFVAFSLLFAYYHLKVPLSIFKREKEIARNLEFDGLYIANQPSDDDIKGYWDKLVISTRSFPVNYWDKFVKKRVREKYSETFDHESISNLLGMDKSSSFLTDKVESSGIFSFLTGIDWKYQVWKCGVTFTDNAFLYNIWYLLFSILGNYNYFFFAAHLIDVAIGFKTLRTILQSVTHNGKQLVLTMMLLMIVCYMYTVVAFNFFRKFYVQEEDDQVEAKCHDMFTCFMFHLYKGVRAGGGIGDEIEAPDGDEYEAYRILFDFTFFFFVIVILLAIIQGLIIDAFGELRDQLQSVVEDMESNCFICGIGKEYFDKVPHGFDTHVQKEHNLANYMFFLMHLINKPDTEYTGQETYVWEMYQRRCWDFIPVGDCFRKQYEDELISAN